MKIGTLAIADEVIGKKVPSKTGASAVASADEDDLRRIAPSHHGYIVEINPNGLCCTSPMTPFRKLSLPGLILFQS
jgi:hypothetical protein